MLRPLFIAIQFLTRLPLPKGALKEQHYQPAQLGQSVLMYPVVGLLIGAILYAVLWLLHYLEPQLSNIIIAAILLFAWVLITGALHLDGLSDSADAWVGGYGDKDKTLAIMKDPYCGPAGVSIIVLVLLLKFAVLTAVSVEAYLGLLLAPVIARSGVLVLFMTTDYVRKEGIGASHAAMLPRFAAWGIVFLVWAICVYLLRVKALSLLMIVTFVFVTLRYLMIKRIGGTTGDTAGGMVEVLEVVVMSVMVILA